MNRPSFTNNPRVAATTAAGIAVAIAMLLLDMEPRLVLLVLVIAACATTLFLAADTADRMAVIRWQDFDSTQRTTPLGDRRVLLLKSSVNRSARERKPRRNAEESEQVNEVADTLLSLIDEYLFTEHGIDRAQDEAAASAVLGASLTSFTTDPSVRHSMTRPRKLSSTLDAIAALTTRSANPKIQNESSPRAHS